MRAVMCAVVVLALWLLLFWSAEPAVVAVGAVLALIVGVAMGKVFPGILTKWIDPRRWFFAAVYLPYFLYYCVRANLDVMVRVLHPDVPIRPGIVKVPTNLTDPMAKTFLANSITLTPGTLTIDIDGQDLYIHWINIHTEDPRQRFAEIVGRFEPLLRRIFE